MTYRLVFFFLIACIGLSSCSMQARTGYIDKKDFIEQNAAVAKISAALSERASSVKKYRALARVQLSKAAVKNTSKYAVVYSKPKLRLEVFATELNTLLAMMIAKDGYIKAYDQKNKIAYIGESSAKNIWQLLTLPFSAGELALFLVAKFYPENIDNISNIRLTARPKSNQKIYSYVQGNLRFEMLLSEISENPTNLRLDAIDVAQTSDSAVVFAAKYQYLADPVSDVPVKVNFFLPSHDLDGEITFENFENEPFIELFENKLFSLEFPSGVVVVDLDMEAQNMANGLLY